MWVLKKWQGRNSSGGREAAEMWPFLEAQGGQRQESMQAELELPVSKRCEAHLSQLGEEVEAGWNQHGEIKQTVSQRAKLAMVPLQPKPKVKFPRSARPTKPCGF